MVLNGDGKAPLNYLALVGIAPIGAFFVYGGLYHCRGNEFSIILAPIIYDDYGGDGHGREYQYADHDAIAADYPGNVPPF